MFSPKNQCFVNSSFPLTSKNRPVYFSCKHSFIYNHISSKQHKVHQPIEWIWIKFCVTVFTFWKKVDTDYKKNNYLLLLIHFFQLQSLTWHDLRVFLCQIQMFSGRHSVVWWGVGGDNNLQLRICCKSLFPFSLLYFPYATAALSWIFLIPIHVKAQVTLNSKKKKKEKAAEWEKQALV
jgi:hypothetical protein